MSRYILTLFKEDRSAWLRICDKAHGPICKVGDKVKISSDFKETGFYKYLGNNTHVVDEITNCKWETFPADQYIGLKGSNHIFLNTILEKK